jgi:outer membrane protein OmpA-like peptidoglycan-associated protein
MQRLTHFILSLLVVILFTGAINAQNTSANDLAAGDNQFYLMGAVLETTTPTITQQDDGILGDKSKIRIINLGPIVNWEGLDYAPTISADGKTLYYVSNRPGSKLNEREDPSHDFWAAKKNDRLDTIFFQPFNIDTSIALGNFGVNTPRNEGAASIAADRQSLYFTACDREDGLGDCDIYKAMIEGDKWGRPVNLGPNVNSKYFDSQPSIAPDQSRVYFISTRPGPNSDGKPKLENFDIWYSDWDFEEEEWMPAKNLEALNTPSEEASPFIAADNVTLFFASDGHEPNIGGLDFYVTRNIGEEGEMQWTKPENLGEPINTEDNEQFITLPASGDVLYFSSTRTDLPAYQGNLDIFMAFVPTFFRAVNVIVTVVDECSGINIPAVVSIKNPVTGRTFTDSLTLNRTSVEMIVSNTDYGRISDSLKFIDLQVTAVNPKYGMTSVVQRVKKPKVTKDINETKEYADVINIVLTLGQRPVLGKIIDEAAYVKAHKVEDTTLAGFNGLVMEQFQTWELYPLLNYVFFDLGSSEIPSRYNLFQNSSQIVNFTDTTIAGGTLDKYYHLLNIYGYRMKKFPKAKIDIVGCNDGTTKEEKRPGLSKERAENVYNYLKNVWGIDESRMKIVVRKKPKVISNLKDSLGIVENRRVEIISKEWEIMKPVFDKDPKTFPQPETMKFTMKNGIENALVTKRRIEVKYGENPWKTLTDIGITDAETEWDWMNDDDEYPKEELPYQAKLVLTTTSGRECESDPINIPVMQVTTTKKRVQRIKDTTIERYSLILFPFDRSDAGPLNERIMRDYVYDRCKPNSLIEVIGHTDVVGLYEHNQKLSVRRSNTVYKGIMRKTKGKFAKIIKRGVGEDEPLYDNSLPEGRFYNRTVQVIIRTPIEN